MSEPSYDDLAAQFVKSSATAPAATTVAAPSAVVAAAPAASKPDPFDALASQMVQGQNAQVRNNLVAASARNPDQAARDRELAQQTGTPETAVPTQRPVLEAQRLAAGNASLATDHPDLASWLAAHPYNASVSHDDIDRLKGISAIAQSARPAIDYSGMTHLADDHKALSAEMDSLEGGAMEFAKGFGENANAAMGAVGTVEGAFPTLWDQVASLATGKDRHEASDWWFRQMVDPTVENRPAFELPKGASLSLKALHATGALVDLMANVAATGGMGETTALPAGASGLDAAGAAIAHGTKSMAFPALTGAVNTGRDVYGETGSGAQAANAAAMSYATNTLMGVMPLSAPGGVLRRAVQGALSMPLTAEVGRQGMNAVMPGSMQQPFSVDDLIVNALTGSIMSTVMGPRAQPDYHADIRAQYERIAAADQATQTIDQVRQLGALSADSKLRTRDPGAFQQLVSQMTEGGKLEAVWVKASDFLGALHQTAVPLEEVQAKMPEVARQLTEATETSGDLRIPVSDYATLIAGSPIEQHLLGKLKVEPGGETYEENQKTVESARADMADVAKRLADTTEERAVFRNDARSVYENVLGQLKATGRYTDDVAQQYATLVAARYATDAVRHGMKPSEMFQRMPLDIGSEAITGGLQQTPEAEHGPFGPVFRGYEGDSAGAIERMLKERKGEAIGALHYPGIGPIDLVWGSEGKGASDGYGLAKIARWHPEVLGDLQGILDGLEVSSRTDNRIQLESADHKAAVRLTWDGAAKHWLLTAFRKDGEDGSGASTRTDTASQETGMARPVAESSDGSVDEALRNYYQGRQDITRGAYDPVSSTIALFKNADLSTFLHETGHHFLEMTAQFASSQDAPAGYAEDMGKLLDWFGIKGSPEESALDQWNRMSLDEKRDAHEKFARGFERYLLEGKAPSVELASAFAKFRAWLLNIYKSIRGTNAELSPEVRGVMDRMLATDSAIEEAESVRGYRSMFESAAEANMTPEQFAAYQALGTRATQDATAELDAKSVGDMKWLNNATGRLMRGLQRQADAQRREVRSEARMDVERQPVYQAWRWLTGDMEPAAKVAKEKATKAVDPTRDSLFTAIAKLGGIDRAQLKAEFGLGDEDLKGIRADGTSKAVVKRGGRSFDDLLQSLADEGYVSTDVHGKADIADLHELLQRELAGNKQYSNQADPSVLMGWRDAPQQIDGRADAGRLNTSDLKAMLGSEPDAPWRQLTHLGMTSDSTNGYHPDVVAEHFGFSSGKELVDTLLKAPKPHEAVETLTDQRMLERHGEMATPDGIRRAAEEAIHNDARSRFVATALKALSKAKGPVDTLLEAAKQAADAAINAKVVRELRPDRYAAAEARAAKAAAEAFKKGETSQAAVETRSQLLNNQLWKAANAAKAEAVKSLEYLKKFASPGIRDKLDGEFLAQIDAILSKINLRQDSMPTNRKVENLQQWAQGLRDNGYEPQIAQWLVDLATPKHWRDLTVEELRGTRDTVRSIEHIARARKTLMVEGKKADVADIVKGLVDRMLERGNKFTKEQLLEPPTAAVDGYWSALTHWLGTKMRLIDSDLKPQEFRFNKLDLHEIDGPFRRALLDRMLDANYRKVDLTKQASDAAGKVGAELGKDWQRSLYDLVTNTKLGDPDLGGMMKITRGRMLGIARHVGNESNFDRLVSGYGWAPADVWGFLHDNMTANDWKATQAHWDSFDPLWKETEAMIKRLGGVPPPKIPAREFNTPFGPMRGGYSPIDYDPARSKLSASRGEFTLEAGDQIGNMPKYTATTTSNGSLNARAEGYTDKVSLDFHSAEGRIRDTIHDLAYREALLDAKKIVNDPKFREQFQLSYGKQEYAAIVDWLRSIAETNVADPRTRNFDKAMQYMRTGVVLTGIGYRVSTVMKHGGAAALKSLGYLGSGEGAKYFAARVARMGSGHMMEDIAAAKDKFPEIRTRALQMDRDYKVGTKSMYEAEDWRAKNDRFGHAMVAWSDLLSAVPTAWAAYDLAKTSGVPVNMGGTGQPMTEAQAVRYANEVVRQAHGSALEVTRSNYLQNRGLKGLFGALYGFMNNTYGQMGDMLDKSVTGGHFANKPAIAARLMATLIIPAIWTQWLKDSGPGDDENGMLWGLKALTGEVAATVPFVRDGWSFLEQGRASQVAPAQGGSDVLNVGLDLQKEAEGKHSRLIQDTFNSIGEWAHIAGLGQLGHILQYAHDVKDGKKDPETAPQAIKEAVVGGKPAKQ